MHRKRFSLCLRHACLQLGFQLRANIVRSHHRSNDALQSSVLIADSASIHVKIVSLCDVEPRATSLSVYRHTATDLTFIFIVLYITSYNSRPPFLLIEKVAIDGKRVKLVFLLFVKQEGVFILQDNTRKPRRSDLFYIRR